jgi:phosphomannomutase
LFWLKFMDVNPLVFKSYDVRGVYPFEINESTAAQVAIAFASVLGADKIVIGRDARLSSPALHQAVVRELLSMGVDVYDLGVCTTPLLNYAVVARNFRGGIMISASHNPKEFNALKLIRGGVQLSSPGGLDEVKRIVLEHKSVSGIRQAKGKAYFLDLLGDYVNELAEEFQSLAGMRLVVDYANGVGSITAKPFFERIGLKVTALNEEIDGTFPVHPANPADENNLEQLKREVLATKADAGIAFDGDADRSFIIDDLGRIIYPDIYTCIIARRQLAGRTEKRVYLDLRFSKKAFEEVSAQGGEPVMMRVGNPFYKEKLKKEGGLFAAELSGHVMFQDHYNIDDGLYAAIKLLHLARVEGRKLSELASKHLVYFSTPELNFEVSNPDEVLERARLAYNGGRKVELDGVYVEFEDWWFSLRKSNTENLVRLRLEAKNKELLEEKKQQLEALINS